MADTDSGLLPAGDLGAPLIGRDEALHRLRKAYNEAVDARSCRAVTLIGANGSGKSRLVHELLSSLPPLGAGGPQVYVARARRQGLSYGVFGRLLRARFSVSEDMPPDAARQSMTAQVAEVLGDQKVGDVCYFLGQLLGLRFPESPLTEAANDDASQARSLRGALLRRFLEADAAAAPLVLVFEDLHFADGDSMDLLASLIIHLNAPTLIVCAGGREMLSGQNDWASLGAERHDVVELAPLSHADAAEMIRRLLHRSEGGVPDALVEAAVRAAGGNPGQLAQMVRSYLDSGVLEEATGEGGATVWRVNLARLNTVRLPMSVEDAVAIRISALAPAERRLLEHAAAMGSVFWQGGLVALSRMDQEVPSLWTEAHGADIARLREVLRGLVERDYLLELDDAVFPDEKEYVFKHNFEREKISALTSAAAARRYHQTIADWLAQKRGARSEEEYVAMLAQHLERAGSLTRSAFTFLDAGDIARSGFATRKAHEYYAKGLALLGDDDARRRVDALHNHGDVLQLLGKTDEALEAFRQMLAIAFRLNLLGKGGAAHNRIGRLYRDTGSLDQSAEHLNAARELFGAAQDQRGVAASHDDMGRLLWMRGEYDAALKELRLALDMRKQLGDRRSIALSLNNMGLVWADHGRPTNAKEALEAALAMRREIGDPVGISESLSTLGELATDQTQYEQALAYYRESHQVAMDIGERSRIAQSLTCIGETLQRLGKGREAVETLERAVSLCEELGDKMQLAEARRGLAKSYLLKGELRRAREQIRSAVDLFGQVRSKAHLAIALRTLGEITGAGAWGAKHEARAVEYFMRSIAICKEIGNEIEVARSYMAFSKYVTQSDVYKNNTDIQREAAKLQTMASEIFEQHRIPLPAAPHAGGPGSAPPPALSPESIASYSMPPQSLVPRSLEPRSMAPQSPRSLDPRSGHAASQQGHAGTPRADAAPGGAGAPAPGSLSPAANGAGAPSVGSPKPNPRSPHNR